MVVVVIVVELVIAKREREREERRMDQHNSSRVRWVLEFRKGSK